MKNNNHLVRFSGTTMSLMVTVAIMICSDIAFSQESVANELLDRRVTIVSSNLTFHQVLEVVSRKTKTPIVVVDIDKARLSPSKEKIEIRARTIGEILRQSAKQMPDLNWHEDDGILTVSFSNSSRTFMNMKLKPICLESVSMNELRNAILFNPAFNENLKGFNLRVAPMNEVIGGSLNEDRKISVDMSDSSLTDLLRFVVKSTTVKFFSIQRTGDKSQFISISFSDDR